MLDESIVATHQQKSAADQVDVAIQQISQAADSLAAEQARRRHRQPLEELVAEIEQGLQAGGLAKAGQAAGVAGWPGPGSGRPAAGNGHVLTTIPAPAASAAGDPGGAR